MSAQGPGEITQLLADVREGDIQAESRLAALVYDELHRIAAGCMQHERPGHTLQATVLVHDAYMHLVSLQDRNWESRAHFFAVAAQLMRRILIDHARSRNAAKRGGGLMVPLLDEAVVICETDWDRLLAVDEALNRLAGRDARMGRIVEMRFFAGLTEDEIAGVLRISPRTVKRDWIVAKAWLHGELSRARPDEHGPVAKS